MVAPTITAVSTLIADADTDTNWTNGSLDTDSEVQGTGCVGAKVSNATVNFIYDASGNPDSPYDFSSGGAFEGQHIYVWLNCLTPTLDTFANGGLRIFVGDGTNQAVWYVAGSDANYNGGWKNFVIDPSRDFDEIIAGTWTLTGNPAQLNAVTQFGGTVKTIATIMGNFNNGLVDAIRVGTGLRITDGDATDPGTWDALVAADDGTKANKYGVVREQSGVVFVQGTVEFGSGSTSSLFEDAGEIIAFENALVADDFYNLQIAGNTTLTFGTSSGEAEDQLGISGIVTSTGTTASKPAFTIAESIPDLELFALNSILASSVSLGTADTPVTGSALSLLDNTFDQSQLITLNLSSSGLTMARNRSVNSLAGTVSGSIRLINPKEIDGAEWSVVLGNGFSSLDDATTETYTVSNHDFSTNTQFVRVFQNKTWDIISPTGFTINTGSQTQLNFATASGTEVNEKYKIDVLTQTAAGTTISQSAVYVYEGLLNQNLPVDNQMYTQTAGTASSDILVNRFTSVDAGAGLGVTSSGDFVLKAYRYGYNPFVTSLTVNQALNQTVNFAIDSGLSSETSSSAITAGSTSIVPIKHAPGETDPLPLLVFHFDGGAGTAPSAGQIVSGTTSTAQGSVLELRYGDATEAYLVLSGWNGIQFTNNETIGNDSGWSALADTTGGASSFQENYTWEYQMAGFSHQIVYDYDRARTSQEPVNALAIYQDTVIWGEEEQSNMIYSNGSTYFTERSVAREEGVWLANPSDAGVVNYMTSDSGSQFIPPQSFTFTLTGLQSLSEVRIYDTSTSPPTELAGTENSSNTFSYNYVYGGVDIDIFVVIFHLQFQDIRLVNLTLSNSDQSIPIQQTTDRVYSNP